MAGSANQLQTGVEEVGAEAVYCPGCGFDLRGTTSGRCGECGLEVDREALRVSGIPWAHRGKMGRVRAYLKTVWQISWGDRRLRSEAAKPQDLGDGRRFARVTGCIVALAFIGVLIAMRAGDNPNPFLVRNGGSWPAAPDDTAMDFWVPWSTGAQFLPVLPLCLTLFALALTSVQRAAFRTRASPEQERRAKALAYYTTSPMVLLLPSVFCLIGGTIFDRWNVRPYATLSAWLFVSAQILMLFAVFGSLFRVFGWLMRVRNCGWFGAIPGLVELISLWTLSWLVFLALLPWCAGFVWLVIDSLRG